MRSPSDPCGPNISSASDQQRRFWKELVTLRIHTYYLSEYYSKSEKIDRCINSFLAISSSGGIAGWVIWNEWGFVWAFIIAVSQLINAIKNYLPYKNRMKCTDKLMIALENLFYYAESKWFNVSQGLLSNADINKLTARIARAKNKYINSILGGGEGSLPRNDKLMSIAEDMARKYFAPI
jgi:hypothetical protein